MFVDIKPLEPSFLLHSMRAMLFVLLLFAMCFGVNAQSSCPYGTAYDVGSQSCLNVNECLDSDACIVGLTCSDSNATADTIDAHPQAYICLPPPGSEIQAPLAIAKNPFGTFGWSDDAHTCAYTEPISVMFPSLLNISFTPGPVDIGLPNSMTFGNSTTLYFNGECDAPSSQQLGTCIGSSTGVRMINAVMCKEGQIPCMINVTFLDANEGVNERFTMFGDKDAFPDFGNVQGAFDIFHQPTPRMYDHFFDTYIALPYVDQLFNVSAFFVREAGSSAYFTANTTHIRFDIDDNVRMYLMGTVDFIRDDTIVACAAGTVNGAQEPFCADVIAGTFPTLNGTESIVTVDSITDDPLVTDTCVALSHGWRYLTTSTTPTGSAGAYVFPAGRLSISYHFDSGCNSNTPFDLSQFTSDPAHRFFFDFNIDDNTGGTGTVEVHVIDTNGYNISSIPTFAPAALGATRLTIFGSDSRMGRIEFTFTDLGISSPTMSIVPDVRSGGLVAEQCPDFTYSLREDTYCSICPSSSLGSIIPRASEYYCACPANTYLDGINHACTHCPFLSNSSSGTVNISGCTCPYGRGINGSGECGILPGFYADPNGQNGETLVCPFGTYSEGDVDYCTDCPHGWLAYDSPNPADHVSYQTACRICTGDTYCLGGNNTDAFPCPLYATGAPDRSSVYSCQCPFGMGFNGDNTECVNNVECGGNDEGQCASGFICTDNVVTFPDPAGPHPDPYTCALANPGKEVFASLAILKFIAFGLDLDASTPSCGVGTVFIPANFISISQYSLYPRPTAYSNAIMMNVSTTLRFKGDCDDGNTPSLNQIIENAYGIRFALATLCKPGHTPCQVHVKFKDASNNTRYDYPVTSYVDTFPDISQINGLFDTNGQQNGVFGNTVPPRLQENFLFEYADYPVATDRFITMNLLFADVKGSNVPFNGGVDHVNFEFDNDDVEFVFFASWDFILAPQLRDCPAGWANNGSFFTCQPCEANTFAQFTGASACENCPTDSTGTVAMSQSIRDCNCDSNLYRTNFQYSGETPTAFECVTRVDCSTSGDACPFNSICETPPIPQDNLANCTCQDPYTNAGPFTCAPGPNSPDAPFVLHASDVSNVNQPLGINTALTDILLIAEEGQDSFVTPVIAICPNLEDAFVNFYFNSTNIDATSATPGLPFVRFSDSCTPPGRIQLQGIPNTRTTFELNTDASLLSSDVPVMAMNDIIFNVRSATQFQYLGQVDTHNTFFVNMFTSTPFEFQGRESVVRPEIADPAPFTTPLDYFNTEQLDTGGGTCLDVTNDNMATVTGMGSRTFSGLGHMDQDGNHLGIFFSGDVLQYRTGVCSDVAPLPATISKRYAHLLVAYLGSVSVRWLDRNLNTISITALDHVEDYYFNVILDRPTNARTVQFEGFENPTTLQYLSWSLSNSVYFTNQLFYDNMGVIQNGSTCSIGAWSVQPNAFISRNWTSVLQLSGGYMNNDDLLEYSTSPSCNPNNLVKVPSNYRSLSLNYIGSITVSFYDTHQRLIKIDGSDVFPQQDNAGYQTTSMPTTTARIVIHSLADGTQVIGSFIGLANSPPSTPPISTVPLQTQLDSFQTVQGDGTCFDIMHNSFTNLNGFTVRSLSSGVSLDGANPPSLNTGQSITYRTGRCSDSTPYTTALPSRYQHLFVQASGMLQMQFIDSSGSALTDNTFDLLGDSDIMDVPDGTRGLVFTAQQDAAQISGLTWSLSETQYYVGLISLDAMTTGSDANSCVSSWDGQNTAFTGRFWSGTNPFSGGAMPQNAFVQYTTQSECDVNTDSTVPADYITLVIDYEGDIGVTFYSDGMTWVRNDYGTVFAGHNPNGAVWRLPMPDTTKAFRITSNNDNTILHSVSIGSTNETPTAHGDFNVGGGGGGSCPANAGGDGTACSNQVDCHDISDVAFADYVDDANNNFVDVSPGQDSGTGLDDVALAGELTTFKCRYWFSPMGEPGFSEFYLLFHYTNSYLLYSLDSCSSSHTTTIACDRRNLIVGADNGAWQVDLLDTQSSVIATRSAPHTDFGLYILLTMPPETSQIKVTSLEDSASITSIRLGKPSEAYWGPLDDLGTSQSSGTCVTHADAPDLLEGFARTVTNLASDIDGSGCVHLGNGGELTYTFGTCSGPTSNAISFSSSSAIYETIYFLLQGTATYTFFDDQGAAVGATNQPTEPLSPSVYQQIPVYAPGPSASIRLHGASSDASICFVQFGPDNHFTWEPYP